MDVVKFEDFRLAWLHTFVCVVRLGGFSNAAKYAGISQSTASRHVDDLASWIGRDLLTSTRPPRMTEDGEKVYELAEGVISAVCDIDRLLLRASRTKLTATGVEFEEAKFSPQELEKIRAWRIFSQP